MLILTQLMLWSINLKILGSKEKEKTCNEEIEFLKEQKNKLNILTDKVHKLYKEGAL